MPYSYEQCQAFAAAHARGQQVPEDWRDQCRGVKRQGKTKRIKKGSLKQTKGKL